MDQLQAKMSESHCSYLSFNSLSSITISQVLLWVDLQHPEIVIFDHIYQWYHCVLRRGFAKLLTLPFCLVSSQRNMNFVAEVLKDNMLGG